ncbi:restriction endonuclease subunit S [Psychrosphaera sp. 1_MG-2023]|uniref:restriction endonuclease subunit S n=1 Tax=Psychrosphaera sp. 1_MG-2023 TaxID=3062643 RepID=UPI0026E3598C|nr:restriction endonuclease subunit S [Psychrosphaera sp. 1_MG-2023]MDO6718698.1 restriction endonuclease subunit S [Psychrosphaera sp. 1_MG-2023]
MSWPKVKLKDCCKVIGGATPKRNVPEYWESDDVPWVTPKDVSNLTDKTLLDAPEYISQLGFDKCATYLLPKGSILLTSRAPIGNVAIAGKDMCTNQGFKSLVAGEGVDSTYLYYCMLTHSKHLDALGNGATFKEVSKKVVEEFEIPLPPLEEQKRIAAILDKADAIRRKRQQAINLADDFLRNVFLDMFGDPVTNPKGYEKVCLGQVCTIKGGKRIPKGEKLVKENTGYPYIKAGNIKNGKVNSNKLEYVPHHVREKIARYTVDAGDVCLTVVGANIGDVGVVPDELHSASLTENANKLLIQNKKIITNFYLASALQMDFIQNQIKSKTMAVGVPKLALFRIEQLEILIPPTELQKRFESIVNTVDSYLGRLSLNQGLCDTQFLALSQKAFAGEL